MCKFPENIVNIHNYIISANEDGSKNNNKSNNNHNNLKENHNTNICYNDIISFFIIHCFLFG